ncbi:CPBP family intramembrane glutamic endopeptidase [Streptomyces sp. DSM 44915]|uniref:CPBP family intramembrane glutamic endopeptidase n=1 Tax=Streptomyces chisholmiae TaxID=3075540 RepID=A0ABU2JRS5_9ACTN|nr:CPBP family intramembrane glutamic endopeptidase [Streptomyces sp. DSM 44915]MDT0267686.1 CPBP family intramembrane glutamic endopeptidase [Streptomyces sp. DSM 44915]
MSSSLPNAAPDAAPAPPQVPAAPGDRYRGDLILFMAVTFALSWACWFTAIAIGGSSKEGPVAAPFMLGAFGPLVGAVVVRARRRRRGEPVPAFAVRFRRQHLLWAPALLVLTSASVLAAALLGHAAGDPALSWENSRDIMDDFGGPAAFLVGLLVSGPLSEEAGWRGTAQPRMRASLSLVRVALVLGVTWAVWHMPLFFIEETVQHDLGLFSGSGVLFIASNIPMAMLAVCAYERGGVVASVAVHFAANATMVLLDVTTATTLAMVTGILAILAALLLTFALPRREPATGDAAPVAGTPPAPPRAPRLVD